MKVVFFGTPDFVLPIPQALLEAGFSVVAVVTNPDRPVGRKQILTPSPVKKWAFKHQIPTLTPEKLDTNSQLSGEARSCFAGLITNYHPDLGVLAAYGKILPQEVIDLFPQGILVVHPSLLPAYRGASPVQAAILNGDKVTGVSIIKMDEKMDHGPIVSQFKEEIKLDDTAETLYQRLFQKTAEVLVTILPAYIEGCLNPREQDHKKATFCKLLKKEDGFIPYGIIAPKPGATSKCKLGPYEIEPTPENLERFIRAMSPWPGAWTEIETCDTQNATRNIPSSQTCHISPVTCCRRRLKILKAHLEEGKLVLDEVQLEGKKTVPWKQFKETHPEIKLM